MCNASFVGRDELLQTLREGFVDTGIGIQVLCGISGVGKSQLALEYAHRFANDYDLVWWMSAEHPEAMAEQMAALATEAGWLSPSAGTDAAVRMARMQLRKSSRWLLVFDNAEDPTVLRSWLSIGPGHILISSRDPGWFEVGRPLTVNVFDRVESISLLRDRLPWIAMDEAEELARSLGDLPLAVAQAASLLVETGMTPQAYLSELNANARRLLGAGRVLSYRSPLAAALELSIDRLADEDDLALSVMQVSAWLAPNPLPLRTLAATNHVGIDRIAPTDAVAFQLSLGRIGRYGLARINKQSIEIHRLTQAFIRGRLNPQESRLARARAARVVATGRPENDGSDPGTWPEWSALLPHILALDPAVGSSHALRNAARDVLWHLLCRAEYATALRLAQTWRSDWTAGLGPDHLQVLDMNNHLAEAYRHLGAYGQARRLDEDTLRRRKRILGENHNKTLRSANNLAVDFFMMGDFEAARVLDELTLTQCREVLGDSHPDTLLLTSNFAADLRGLGKYEQALHLDETTLSLRVCLLGEYHPGTLRSARNLAADLRGLGRRRQARSLDERTYSQYLQVLGKDHPDTLRVARNLAAEVK
ncbi:FxSxx-COOH system tetratricopeptide repeat protein [Micromonospora sp. NPDC047762]|uniref:FxSxx-COOH system tetratricopeptide repeat protein n=1 Tax=Micromonospora sp. NPDC047762 TaxID=3364255 RepID=UPI00371DFB6F